VGARLPVLLDEGVDLNAYYVQTGAEFLSRPGAVGHRVFGRKPRHRLSRDGPRHIGRDKPAALGAASHEAAAFHESFGDMSAILSALQLQSLRSAILHDTGGHLYQNSRLSRLAEQLDRPSGLNTLMLRIATACAMQSIPSPIRT
jgi:hypothetical protein